MSSIVYKVQTKEISKLVLFVSCTGLQLDHLIDSIFYYYPICRTHNFVLCFLEQVTLADISMLLIVTEARSKSFGLITERRHDIGVLCAVTHIFAYWTSPVSVTHVIFFIGECGIARFLCAMRVFEVWASSSPHMLYFSAKFRFCRAVHCSASPRRKMA